MAYVIVVTRSRTPSEGERLLAKSTDFVRYVAQQFSDPKQLERFGKAEDGQMPDVVFTDSPELRAAYKAEGVTVMPVTVAKRAAVTPKKKAPVRKKAPRKVATRKKRAP